MEEIARRLVGAGPDRHRQEHDICRGKAGNAEGQQELAGLLFARQLVQIAEIDGGGRIAEALQRLEETKRCRARVGAFGREDDGQAAQRQVHPRRDDARKLPQRVLDDGDAGAAVDGRDREDVGDGAVGASAAGVSQFFSPKIGPKDAPFAFGKVKGRAAAAHLRLLTAR